LFVVVSPTMMRPVLCGLFCALGGASNDFFQGGSRIEVADIKKMTHLKDIDGNNFDPHQLLENVWLITNVATECGPTDMECQATEINYRDLGQIDNEMSRVGLRVLAFPCSQFGGKEPGTPEEVRGFAKEYGATFPFMSKVEVNGPDADPLFALLKGPGKDIKANFWAKFILMCTDVDCVVFRREGMQGFPESMKPELVAILQAASRIPRDKSLAPPADVPKSASDEDMHTEEL